MILKLTKLTKQIINASNDDLEIIRQQLEDLERSGYPNVEQINDIEDQIIGDEGNIQVELLKLQVS